MRNFWAITSRPSFLSFIHFFLTLNMSLLFSKCDFKGSKCRDGNLVLERSNMLKTRLFCRSDDSHWGRHGTRSWDFGNHMHAVSGADEDDVGLHRRASHELRVYWQGEDPNNGETQDEQYQVCPKCEVFRSSELE